MGENILRQIANLRFMRIKVLSVVNHYYKHSMRLSETRIEVL